MPAVRAAFLAGRLRACAEAAGHSRAALRKAEELAKRVRGSALLLEDRERRDDRLAGEITLLLVVDTAVATMV